MSAADRVPGDERDRGDGASDEEHGNHDVSLPTRNPERSNRSTLSVAASVATDDLDDCFSPSSSETDDSDDDQVAYSNKRKCKSVLDRGNNKKRQGGEKRNLEVAMRTRAWNARFKELCHYKERLVTPKFQHEAFPRTHNLVVGSDARERSTSVVVLRKTA